MSLINEVTGAGQDFARTTINAVKGAVSRTKLGQLAQPIVSPTNDPDFYGALDLLPNPDPILRKMGRADEVYAKILSDPHVVGEIQAIRGNLLGYNMEIVAGGNDAIDIKAQELCESILERDPAPFTTWDDVVWWLASARFYGCAGLQVLPDTSGTPWMPARIDDVPRRLIRLDTDSNLRIRTKAEPTKGVAVDSDQFVFVRHMPSSTHPYGLATLSCCFWSYIFKHSGLKYFVKFCEKYGIPWATAKVPPGTQTKVRNDTIKQLQQMVEDAVAVFDMGTTIELVEKKGGQGTPVQKLLIDTCNKEMSKALVSQTLGSEQHETGARAASETAVGRQESIDLATMKSLVAPGLQKIFSTYVRWNFNGAKVPKVLFSDDNSPPVEWSDIIVNVAGVAPVDANWAYKRLKMPVPQPGDPVIFTGGNADPALAGIEFSAPSGNKSRQANQSLIDAVATATDAEIEPIIQAAADMAKRFAAENKPLGDLELAFAELMPVADRATIKQIVADGLALSFLQGMDRADANEQ